MGSLTLGDGDGVDHLVLAEHTADTYLLFKQTLSKVNLFRDGATIDLDFDQVRLLDSQAHKLRLSMCQQTHGSGFLLQLVQLLVDALASVLVLSRVLLESLLLCPVPVLVEPPLQGLVQVLSPNATHGPLPPVGLLVTNHAYNHHGRALNDGDRLAGFLLVQLGAGLVHVTDDVAHARLEAHEGGQVGGLGWVILGEGLYAPTAAAAALLGEETQGTATWVFKFSM